VISGEVYDRIRKVGWGKLRLCGYIYGSLCLADKCPYKPEEAFSEAIYCRDRLMIRKLR